MGEALRYYCIRFTTQMPRKSKNHHDTCRATPGDILPNVLQNANQTQPTQIGDGCAIIFFLGRRRAEQKKTCNGGVTRLAPVMGQLSCVFNSSQNYDMIDQWSSFGFHVEAQPIICDSFSYEKSQVNGLRLNKISLFMICCQVQRLASVSTGSMFYIGKATSPNISEPQYS